MKLFVSVAAFCEPYLLFTLSDAIKKASNPELIVFGVVDQHPINRKGDIVSAIPNINLRYLHINPLETRGVSWARSMVFSLFQDEEFVLQIDSHTFFEDNWDTILYHQHAMLLGKSTLDNPIKPIISTYPYGFEFNDGKPVINVNVGTETVLVLRPHHETSLSDDCAKLRFRAEHVFTKEPVLGCHIAGGFLFASGELLSEVPYDPYLYFHGEEQSIAIRAWTHGWDIYHLLKIPLYHLYKIPNTPHTTHHWHPNWDAQRDFKSTELLKSSSKRLADLLYQRKDLGIYGMGTVRSLSEYAKFCGINYLDKTIVRQYQTSYDL